jgi:hypothetical protein
MRSLTYASGLILALAAPLATVQAGWHHWHRGGCAGGVSTGAMAVAPGTTVLGSSAMASSYFVPAAASFQVVPASSLAVVSANNAAFAGSGAESSISEARSQGIREAFDIVLPIIKLIFETRQPPVNGGGCTCPGGAPGLGSGGIPGLSVPKAVPDNMGASRASGNREVYISSQQSFDDRLQSIRLLQSQSEETLWRLEKMFPAE